MKTVEYRVLEECARSSKSGCDTGRRFSFRFESFHVLWTALPDKDEAEMSRREDKHNPHYWEVGRKSFPKKDILREIEECDLRVIKEMHNPLHPYHLFVLCEVG